MAAPYPIDYSHKSGFEMPNVGHKAHTFSRPLFRIGTGDTTGTAVHIGTTLIPLVDIRAVTSLTAGNSIPVQTKLTRLVGSTTGYDRGMYIEYATEVRAPNVTGMKINVDFGTDGFSHNRAAVLCAELNMPNHSATRGNYSCLELEMVIDAASAWHSAGRCSFIYCGVNGTVANWNTYGYLFDIQGATDVANGFLDDTAGGVSDISVKCRINAKDVWLFFSESPSSA